MIPTATIEVDRADYRVELNPANPGHFLAVCGIAKLHSEMDSLAVSWFETDDDGAVSFCGSTMSSLEEDRIPLAAITDKLVESEISERPRRTVELAGFALTIDWWTRENSPNLKTWAGAQNPAKMLTRLLNLTGSLPENRSDLLTQTAPIDKSPFNYDANLILEETNLHWSRDAAKKPAAAGRVRFRRNVAPWVEALAFIGAQIIPAFDSDAYRYALWHNPLPISLAALSLNAPIGQTSIYESRRVKRPANDKYSAFGIARRID